MIKMCSVANYEKFFQSYCEVIMPIRHILVVEKDDNIIKLLKDQLGQDYQILLVSFGGKAIQIVKEGQIDLAIVSQDLPDMNGMDVLQKLKMRCPALPIIFVADTPIENHNKSTLQLGVKHYFEKPINEKNFLTYIKNVMKSGDNGKDEYQSIKPDNELRSDTQKFGILL